MDLNYLFHRHSVSLAMADRAACDQSRDAHLKMAAAYAQNIATALGRDEKFQA